MMFRFIKLTWHPKAVDSLVKFPAMAEKIMFLLILKQINELVLYTVYSVGP